MKFYYAQSGDKKICLTEQFYNWLKSKNQAYNAGNISIPLQEFIEKDHELSLPSRGNANKERRNDASNTFR